MTLLKNIIIRGKYVKEVRYILVVSLMTDYTEYFNMVHQ